MSNTALLHRRALMSAEPLTLDKCVELGYFTKARITDNTLGDWVIRYTLVKPFPYSLSSISDYYDKCVDSSKWEQVKDDGGIIPCQVCNPSYSSTYLTKSQQYEIVDYCNSGNLKVPLAHLYFGAMNQCGDKSITLNLSPFPKSDWVLAYQQGNDAFAGSKFKEININVKDGGRISVLQNMFRRCTANKISFSGNVSPTDASGAFEFNSGFTTAASHPNTIDWSSCNNIGYTWEWCNNLQEIPSFYTVTDEASRINTPQNCIGYYSPICWADQTFSICRQLRKIGPVLNLLFVTPNSTGLPANMFNDSLQISDIRLKNLSNGNWNFSQNEWRGIPNMDLASIKYCIENLAEQASSHLMRKTVSINNHYSDSVISSSNDFTVKTPSNVTNSNDVLKTKYIKYIIPSGLTVRIYFFQYDGQNEWNPINKERFDTLPNTTEESTWDNDIYSSYPYIVLVLSKTDGTVLTASDIQGYQDAGFSLTIGLANSADTVTEYLALKDFHHTITFSTVQRDAIFNKENISNEIIKTANKKGWTIMVGTEELVPETV